MYTYLIQLGDCLGVIIFYKKDYTQELYPETDYFDCSSASSFFLKKHILMNGVILIYFSI